MTALLETVPPQKNCVLHIDVKAIQENYLALQGFVKSGTICGAVVKADGYGLGQNVLGPALYEKGCRDFFVAYVDEAVELRSALPYADANIYVLSGVLPATESVFHNHDLIPCLISLPQIHRWTLHARALGKPAPCILHVDTGLYREGLNAQELQAFLVGGFAQHLDIRYIMSHLANSNDATAAKNKTQLMRFQAIRQQLAVLGDFRATLVNSSGMTLGPEYQFDLVRPGMALYGYKKENFENLLPLKPCLHAYARVLLIRDVPAGETIGYNCTHWCLRETRVALISVGHGDGILRAASNSSDIHINGRPAPIIGTVSMDVMMVDITDHPKDTVKADMWVDLYHDATTAIDFASKEGTSVYELFVRHGKRYHRIYTEP